MLEATNFTDDGGIWISTPQILGSSQERLRHVAALPNGFRG